MLRSPPFPARPEDLTTEVLSVGLGRPVVSFEATRIGAHRGMMGIITRIEVVYADGSVEPSPVVAKFAALRAGSLDNARRGGNHERELRFYDELAGITPVRTPELHAAWYDPDSEHFLLLQESIDVDEEVDQVDGIGAERVRLVLTEVAQLHATWWDHSSLGLLDWLPAPDAAQRRNNLGTFAVAGWNPLCELLGSDLGADERGLGHGLPEQLEATLTRLASMPETLIHGDLRADNLLFPRGGNRVALVDWQGVARGPAGWDLAYLISQCLTVEDRRAHEQELLDHYRVELANAGHLATEDQVREGYAEGMLLGLVIACALPIVSDEDEERAARLARVFARRSIEGLRDHGRLWTTTP
ncbi:MAG: oxidoreductase family protein [Actinomycetota bacterium]|nr:oxidoreductase family protein [Actinomycetota bacterium]